MADTLFFCPGILTSPVLPEQESHHCVKVLRTREGDRLTVTDGNGFFYDCELVEAHPKRCLVAILHQSEAPTDRSFTLHVAFAPSKQMDRNEWFVEKATEIGIDRFSPLLCEYSERKEIKVERLQKTAVAAMKQSMQARLPAIEAMTRFNDFVARPFEGRKFIAHCQEGFKKPLAESYQKGENALVLIGPEGDFSKEEVTLAIALGFEPVSLGKTRLRSETASLVSLHTLHVINNRA